MRDLQNNIHLIFFKVEHRQVNDLKIGQFLENSCFESCTPCKKCRTTINHFFIVKIKFGLCPGKIKGEIVREVLSPC